MSIVNDAVEDGVGESGFADDAAPVPKESADKMVGTDTPLQMHNLSEFDVGVFADFLKASARRDGPATMTEWRPRFILVSSNRRFRHLLGRDEVN